MRVYSSSGPPISVQWLTDFITICLGVQANSASGVRGPRRRSMAPGRVKKAMIVGEKRCACARVKLKRIVLSNDVIRLHFVGDNVAGAAFDFSVHIHRPMSIPVPIMPVE
jgi:hypothetical protein